MVGRLRGTNFDSSNVVWTDNSSLGAGDESGEGRSNLRAEPVMRE